MIVIVVVIVVVTVCDCVCGCVWCVLICDFDGVCLWCRAVVFELCCYCFVMHELCSDLCGGWCCYVMFLG